MYNNNNRLLNRYKITVAPHMDKKTQPKARIENMTQKRQWGQHDIIRPGLLGGLCGQMKTKKTFEGVTRSIKNT